MLVRQLLNVILLQEESGCLQAYGLLQIRPIRQEASGTSIGQLNMQRIEDEGQWTANKLFRGSIGASESRGSCRLMQLFLRALDLLQYGVRCASWLLYVCFFLIFLLLA